MSYFKISIFLAIYIRAFNLNVESRIFLVEIPNFYIILPSSLQYFPVGPDILTSAMLFIVFEFPIVHVSVCIFYLPSARYRIIFKIANIRLIERVQI